MKIKILGNGVWGNALYSVLIQNNATVSFLERGEKTADQDVVVLSLPTQAMRDALQNISFTGKHKIVINSSKGVERDTYLLPSQIVHSVLGEDIEYYSLIGPGFAEEVVEKMPTLVNLGYKHESVNNQKIRELFLTDFFRVRLSKGIDVLEISAALKNVYAIACGLAHGLGYATNTRIKLLVLAIEEMNTLYKNLQLDADANITAGTLGDLILTCNSINSRNFKFGTLLARYKVSEALQLVDSTVEGYNTLASIDYFKEKAHTELPLASFIYQIVTNDNPKEVKKNFDNYMKSI